MSLVTVTFPVHDEPLPLRRRLEICFEAQGISVPIKDVILAWNTPIARRVVAGGRRAGRDAALAAFTHAVDAKVISHEPREPSRGKASFTCR